MALPKNPATLGRRHLAALNVTVEQRIKQLEASLLRTTTIGFNFGTRFVAVNIPAAFVETVENDKVVRRYRVVSAKPKSRLRPSRLRSLISI